MACISPSWSVSIMQRPQPANLWGWLDSSVLKQRQPEDDPDKHRENKDTDLWAMISIQTDTHYSHKHTDGSMDEIWQMDKTCVYRQNQVSVACVNSLSEASLLNHQTTAEQHSAAFFRYIHLTHSKYCISSDNWKYCTEIQLWKK